MKVVFFLLILSFVSKTIFTNWKSTKIPFKLKNIDPHKKKRRLKKKLKELNTKKRKIKKIKTKLLILKKKETPETYDISDEDKKKYIECFLSIKLKEHEKIDLKNMPYYSEKFFKIIQETYDQEFPNQKTLKKLIKFYTQIIFTRTAGSLATKKRHAHFAYHSIKLLLMNKMVEEQYEDIDSKERVANPQGEIEKINESLYIGRPYPLWKKFLWLSGGVVVYPTFIVCKKTTKLISEKIKRLKKFYNFFTFIFRPFAKKN